MNTLHLASNNCGILSVGAASGYIAIVQTYLISTSAVVPREIPAKPSPEKHLCAPAEHLPSPTQLAPMLWAEQPWNMHINPKVHHRSRTAQPLAPLQHKHLNLAFSAASGSAFLTAAAVQHLQKVSFHLEIFHCIYFTATADLQNKAFQN